MDDRQTGRQTHRHEIHLTIQVDYNEIIKGFEWSDGRTTTVTMCQKEIASLWAILKLKKIIRSDIHCGQCIIINHTLRWMGKFKAIKILIANFK